MVSGATDAGAKQGARGARGTQAAVAAQAAGAAPAAPIASRTRAAQTAFLEAPVTRVRFAKGRRASGLAKLGIHTVRDLLTQYPHRYNDFSQIVALAAAPLGVQVSVLGVVDEVKVKHPKPRMTIVEISIVDGTGVLIASWFNQPWLAQNLRKGTQVLLLGRIEHSFGFKRMQSPLHTVVAEHDEDGENDGDAPPPPPALPAPSASSTSPAMGIALAAGSILPVYGATAALSSAWIARLVREALDAAPALLDPLPAALRSRQGLLSRHAALRAIHFPASQDERAQATRRLAFEEVLYLQLFFRMRRRVEEAQSQPYRHVTKGAAVARLQAELPFTLTADQQASIEQIGALMALPQRMNCLLMGDVGSGKTIVAAHALAMAASSGWQAAMMAPTEVLAQQYALKLGPLLDAAGIRWGLLTSSVDKASRATLLQDLADGLCCVAFGTHALLEPDVRFRQLSLVVIDEQHRFGVAQRQALKDKGSGCDLLAMTATPIPRSLALVLYGDMETSYLRTRPQSTTRTSTRILRKNLRGKAYQAIGSAVAAGHQAYIICPLITAADGSGETRGTKAAAPHDAPLVDDEAPPPLLTEFSDEQDAEHIAAAEQEVAFLKAKVFPAQTVELMTSRLSAQAKRTVMDDFREGRIDILVSTTVVEVGVDVPNATVMIIEDADRFGLSQLHQLRGRVGRGQWDAQVFLISNARGEEAAARLKAMEKTADGFELAEYDLALRREGDVLGSRQHGAAALKLINVIRDGELIALAHREARAILDADPQLERPEHRHLAFELASLYAEEFAEELPCTS